VQKVSIYTRTGDKGATSLFGGKRVSKDSLRVEAYGTIDELNAQMGLCKAVIDNKVLDTIFETIQNKLFTAGSLTATEGGKPFVVNGRTIDITKEDTIWLEKQIDTLDKNLNPITGFILPGGSIAISQVHIARTIARRAERRLVALSDAETLHEQIIPYINRLSDLLFVIARYVAKQSDTKEIYWV